MKRAVAVVGVGVMGANHARLWSAHPRARLAGVVDPDPARAAEIAGKYGCRAFATVEELLRGEKIEAASVAVPTALHTAAAGALLEVGVHVLVEKPLAPTVDEAQQLCRLATRKKCVLMVGHVERFNPAVRKLKQLIDGGTFGQVTSIITRRVGLAPKRIRDADVITDLAVHDVDIANYLMGREPAEVYAHGGHGLLRDRCDFAELFLNYGTANAVISVNWLTPIKIRKLSITGTAGYGELDFVRQELLLYQPPASDRFENFTDFVEKVGREQVQRVPVDVSEPLAAELEHFLGCVEHGRAPEVGCREALAVLDIIGRATRAARVPA